MCRVGKSKCRRCGERNSHCESPIWSHSQCSRGSVGLDAAVTAIEFVLSNETLNGPVNLVTPNAVSNAEFTSTLGRVLGRPTLFPIPAFGARLAFGAMADALLLASQRVHPTRLL